MTRATQSEQEHGNPNAEFLTGFANSFAGAHYQNPREIGFQVRYKFKY